MSSDSSSDSDYVEEEETDEETEDEEIDSEEEDDMNEQEVEEADAIGDAIEEGGEGWPNLPAFPDASFDGLDKQPSSLEKIGYCHERFKAFALGAVDLPERGELHFSVLSDARLRLFVEHDLLQMSPQYPDRRRWLDRRTYKGHQLRHLGNIWLMGYNPNFCGENVNNNIRQYDSGIPRTLMRQLRGIVNRHFNDDPDAYHRLTREHRLPILPCDVALAAFNNHFLTNNYYEDFSLITIGLTSGLRNRTVSKLTLNSFRGIFIDYLTGKVSLNIAFNHWKKEEPYVEKVKRISGYIWATPEFATDPVYFLQRYLLEKSNYKYGLVTFRTLIDDGEDAPVDDSLYGRSIDESLTTPTLAHLQTYPITSFFTILDVKTLHHDPKSEHLWSRCWTYTQPNVDMVKRRFKFYPPEVVTRFVFHSLRNGFYVHTVLTLASFNNWDLPSAVRATCLLGDWAWKTNPSKWYDPNSILHTYIDLSEVQRGNQHYMFQESVTPTTAHQLRRDPDFMDNEDFARLQLRVGLPFVKEILWKCISKCKELYDTLDLNLLGFAPPAGNHTIWFVKERAIKRAMAYYALKCEGRNITQGDSYNYLLENEDELYEACKGYVDMKLWLDHPFKQDFVNTVHKNFCLPLLEFEGLPNYPLWNRPAEVQQQMVDGMMML